jgi:hypothetical protein
MAVSIVQSKTAATAGGGTLSARLNGVTANNTLLTLVLEADGNLPGVPANTGGNTFSPLDWMIQGQANIAVRLDYTLRSAGGNQTVSSTVQAAAQIVVAELAGVATPVPSVQVVNGHTRTVYTPAPIPDGIMDGQAVGHTIAGSISPGCPNGDLVLALVIAAGTPTITFTDPTWIAAASGTNALNLTYDLRMIATAGPATLSPVWAFSADCPFIMTTVAFPAA